MTEWANVYPREGIFAFSGLDGDTPISSLVLRGLADRVGWVLHVGPRLVLRLRLGTEDFYPLFSEEDIWLPDCWRGTVRVGARTGEARGAFADAMSLVMSVRVPEAPEDIAPSLEVEGDARQGVAWHRDGIWFAINRVAMGNRVQFGLGASGTGAEKAARRAEQVARIPVDTLVEQRLAPHYAIKIPDDVWGVTARAFNKAVALQRCHILSTPQGPGTLSSHVPRFCRGPADAAFHILGLEHTYPQAAAAALRRLFARQQPDGALTNAPAGQASIGPLMAWLTWRLASDAALDDVAQDVYDGLARYLEWYDTHRRLPNGLYGWKLNVDDDPVRGARGREAGMDNSPRFDLVKEMTAVDLSSLMASEFRSMARVAKRLGRQSELNRWRDRHATLAELINTLLWDPSDRRYCDLDEHGNLLPLTTSAGLMPLFARVADRDSAEALRTHLRTAWSLGTPVPAASVAQEDPAFSGDFWRGPTWMTTNLLVYYGLVAYGFLEEAHDLAHRSVGEMVRWYNRTGCFYECYDAMGNTPPAELPRKGGVGAQGGDGHGVITDFHNTAAAFLQFVHNLW